VEPLESVAAAPACPLRAILVCALWRRKRSNAQLVLFGEIRDSLDHETYCLVADSFLLSALREALVAVRLAEVEPGQRAAVDAAELSLESVVQLANQRIRLVAKASAILASGPALCGDDRASRDDAAGERAADKLLAPESATEARRDAPEVVVFQSECRLQPLQTRLRSGIPGVEEVVADRLGLIYRNSVRHRCWSLRAWIRETVLAGSALAGKSLHDRTAGWHHRR
jgi:hypothetical protein